MKSVLRYRKLVVQQKWCSPQITRAFHASPPARDTPPFSFDDPDRPQSSSSTHYTTRPDSYRESTWHSQKLPSPSDIVLEGPPHLAELQALLFQSPRPRTAAFSNQVWSIYSSLTPIDRRSLPRVLYRHLLSAVISPLPDGEYIQNIRPPIIPRSPTRDKGKGKVKENAEITQERAILMDEHRSEMAHRLKSILADKGQIGVFALMKVLRGLRRSGNVYELQSMTSELEGMRERRDDPGDWMKTMISTSNLETVLVFLKSAIREKRYIPKERQGDIVKILARELNGFTEGAEKRGVALLTSCFHFARMAFREGDYVRSIDGMMSVALQRVYGFDARFLRVEDEEKWELWDEHVVAAAMGWMGRRGESWRMVAAFDGLVERVKEEKKVVEEYDWRGRRKTAYFDENQGETVKMKDVADKKKEAAVIPAATTASNDEIVDNGPRCFDDFYPSPPLINTLASSSTSTLPSHQLVNHAALYEMMKIATDLNDLPLALHITRIGVIYAKEEQAQWLGSVIALAEGSGTELRPPLLRLHQVPIQHLYNTARAHVRAARRPMRFALFKSIQHLLKDVSERLSSERTILFGKAGEVGVLQKLFSEGKTTLDPGLYSRDLREQEMLIEQMIMLGEERLTTGAIAKARRQASNLANRQRRKAEQEQVRELERQAAEAVSEVEEPARLVRSNEQEEYRLGLSGA